MADGRGKRDGLSERDRIAVEFQKPSSERHGFFYWLWNGRARRGRRGERVPWVRRVAVTAFALSVLLPVALVLVTRVLPPPGTPLMLATWMREGSVTRIWVPLDAISPNLVRAVIAAEDNRFCSHWGFDWEAINAALTFNAQNGGQNGRLRGASTISQQTAKNLFLPASRNWVRKGVEAYFTVLLEALWPKRRILEVYLNIVELGERNFGAEAASRYYFHKPAATLSVAEAARLAAVLPNPQGWSVSNPGPYVRGRTHTISARMAQVDRDGLDRCIVY